jgi:hypothetical protein
MLEAATFGVLRFRLMGETSEENRRKSAVDTLYRRASDDQRVLAT